ncbi:MAG: C40 family peptidase [Caulobacteraceae bacterium]|nr:C40 family peptidase [Caulobacter sp.]
MTGPRFGDAAPAELEGVERAPRYVAAAPCVCAAWEAPILSAPDPGAEQVDQLLHGEPFGRLGQREGWAYGQAGRDGYVGWVEEGALAPASHLADRRVTALRTYVFSRPHLKSTPLGQLSLNALLAAGEAQDGFVAAAEGWVWAAHTAPVGAGFERDIAAVAERFLGAPYRWGGRDSLGLDCSGLVQQALYACGRGCPRDTGDQRRLGRGVDRDAARRSDLVFWPGHVGVMLDHERLIHANAHHMAVSVEPLGEADARITAACGVGCEVRRT